MRAVADEDYRAFVRAQLDSTLALIDVIDVAQLPDFEDKYNWVLPRVEAGGASDPGALAAME